MKYPLYIRNLAVFMTACVLLVVPVKLKADTVFVSQTSQYGNMGVHFLADSNITVRVDNVVVMPTVYKEDGEPADYGSPPYWAQYLSGDGSAYLTTAGTFRISGGDAGAQTLNSSSYASDTWDEISATGTDLHFIFNYPDLQEYQADGKDCRWTVPLIMVNFEVTGGSYTHSTSTDEDDD